MLMNFVGYSGDCTIQGDLESTGDRLRDHLNDFEEYVIENAVLTRLADGKQIAVGRLMLDREELWAAEADGPSGLPDKRLHTVAYQRRAKLGPYAVLGALHERPGVSPLGSLRLTRPFTPFTEARIAFELGGKVRMHEVPTLLVNARLIGWIGDVNGAADDLPAADSPAFAMLLQGV
jgi:hypothetical protein